MWRFRKKMAKLTMLKSMAKEYADEEAEGEGEEAGWVGGDTTYTHYF